MRTYALFILFFLIALKSLSQNSDIEVFQVQKVIGENYTNQKAIEAKEYQFSKHIYKLHIDSVTSNATLQLRKLSKNGKVLSLAGELVVFNLNSNQVKWSQKIDYSINSINQFGSIILLSRGNKNHYLNIEDGTELWNDKNDVYYVNKKNNIAVQYFKNEKENLQGVDLNNGNVIWQRNLSREYGWNKIIRVNDSIFTIVAAGVHTLNIKNGKGWDYNTVTGKKDYTGTIVKNAAGITLGILTGTFITSSGPNLVRDVVSNTLIDSNYIYIASKEKLSKINKNNGELKWSHTLPEDLTSKSSIFIKDSLVYMINQGYGNFGNRQIDFGEPFLLVLNIETGTQKYFTKIGNKGDIIVDFKLETKDILIVLKDRILSYSIEKGTLLNEKIIDTNQFGELQFFVGNSVYIKGNDLQLVNLNASDSTKYFIQNNKGKTLEFDQNLKVCNQYDFKKLYFHYFDFKNYKFFAVGDKTIIQAKNNQIIAEINLPLVPILIGNKLYQINDKSFFEIDLNTVLKDL